MRRVCPFGSAPVEVPYSNFITCPQSRESVITSTKWQWQTYARLWNACSVNLSAKLVIVPTPLKFGTSGRRGRLSDLTQLEIYVNVLGELGYLQSLTPLQGGIVRGDSLYIARDFRPSSPTLCEAVDQAVRDAGLNPVHVGCVPTPALAAFAFARGKGSIMVTGSHIPFDWNGYKLNTSRGELLKSHEAPIDQAVAAVRASVYDDPFPSSLFDDRGALKRPPAIPEPDRSARAEYLRRYLDFFDPRSLAGMRILVYQHSAIGRDLLVELLESLGADIVPAGRSDTFVPIDTEA